MIRALATNRGLLLGVLTCLCTGCAHGRSAGSYLPIGARAQYGASTNDGVTWTSPRPVSQAIDTMATALQREGYSIDDAASTARDLRTTPRALGGDTSLVVHVGFLPVALPAPATSIVLTATYSVPSRKIQDAPVLQRENTVSPLYARLVALAKAVR